MFRHISERGRSFKNVGSSPGFPFIEIDAVHFRQSAQVQHQRDVLDKLGGYPALKRLLEPLYFKGDHNNELEKDVKWREQHMGLDRDYWDFARSQIPRELAEGINFQGPLRRHDACKARQARSLLEERGQFLKGTRLFAAPFRLFHRKNGICTFS